MSNNENRTDCCVIWSFRHSTYSTCTKTFTKFQRILEFSVCLFWMVRKESPSIFQTTFGPSFHKIKMYKRFKWCVSDWRSVSDRLKTRGYPCAKGCNSSASQWLSGEQVRLCSGHPKVHFGTIVEGSWGGGRGVHGRSPGLHDYIYIYIYIYMWCAPTKGTQSVFSTFWGFGRNEN